MADQFGVTQAVVNSVDQVTDQALRGIAGALQEGRREVARITTELSEILLDPNRGSTIRQEFWADNAKDVRAAVLASYRATLRRRWPSPVGYRVDDPHPHTRYSGGQLHDALGDPENIVSDATGIGLFNADHLDIRAKQWWRLNFGTAPHSRTQTIYPVQFGAGVTFAQLTLEGAPSGPLLMPLGSFDSAGAFTVNRSRSPNPKVRTAGVRPRGFLDAGVERLALNLAGKGKPSRSLLALHRKLYRQGVAQVRTTSNVTTGLGARVRVTIQPTGADA